MRIFKLVLVTGSANLFKRYIFLIVDKLDWVAFFSSKGYMKTRIKTNEKDHLLEVSQDCANMHPHPQ